MSVTTLLGRLIQDNTEAQLGQSEQVLFKSWDAQKAARAVLERAKERQLMAQARWAGALRARAQQAGTFAARVQKQEAVAQQPENIEAKRLREQVWLAEAVRLRDQEAAEAKRLRDQEAA
ncbi:hypothetical protein B484DRAFT_406986 [Ochromonadaceae sp. CCMP2298]|nr:hypothetical protein B484DRAFT_406986 [Ochromonadaceae sp. CCMP2298]